MNDQQFEAIMGMLERIATALEGPVVPAIVPGRLKHKPKELNGKRVQRDAWPYISILQQHRDKIVGRWISAAEIFQIAGIEPQKNQWVPMGKAARVLCQDVKNTSTGTRYFF